MGLYSLKYRYLHVVEVSSVPYFRIVESPTARDLVLTQQPSWISGRGLAAARGVTTEGGTDQWLAFEPLSTTHHTTAACLTSKCLHVPVSGSYPYDARRKGHAHPVACFFLSVLAAVCLSFVLPCSALPSAAAWRGANGRVMAGVEDPAAPPPGRGGFRTANVSGKTLESTTNARLQT